MSECERALLGRCRRRQDHLRRTLEVSVRVDTHDSQLDLLCVQVATLTCGCVALWVRVFQKYMAIDLLTCARAPYPSEDRGDMLLMAAWGRWRGLPPVVCRIPDAVPFGLPATTVGEWRRHRSLRRHKRGLWTVLFLPPRIVAGWLLSVAFKVSPNLTKHWGNSSGHWGPRGRLVPVRRSRLCRRHMRGHARDGR